MFEQGPPDGSASFLDTNVIYIGESRATTRNCMLGRRTDFKGTVKNDDFKKWLGFDIKSLIKKKKTFIYE